MKVPIKYKSSDRYNAGTDIVYDDGSKLQYAPFIYAGVTAKDNGEGGDEEGEDTMVIIFDNETQSINKSFKELKEAVTAGKTVVVLYSTTDEHRSVNAFYYLTGLINDNDETYTASFGTVYVDSDTGYNNIDILTVQASSDTVNMAIPGDDDPDDPQG